MKRKNSTKVKSITRPKDKAVSIEGFFGFNNVFGRSWEYVENGMWTGKFSTEGLHISSGMPVHAIRLGNGTHANYIDWNIEQLDRNRINIFQHSSMMTLTDNAYAATGNYNIAYPLSEFDLMRAAFPDVPLYVCINSFTTSVSEAKAFIDKLYALYGGDNTYWELDNETHYDSYETMVSNAFSSLTGSQLDTAYSYFPAGYARADGSGRYDKYAQIADYLTSKGASYVGTSVGHTIWHIRPDASYGDFTAFHEKLAKASVARSELNISSQIIHTYISPDNYWTVFANKDGAGVEQPAFTDTTMFPSLSVSAGAENFYRWIMAFAQTGIHQHFDSTLSMNGRDKDVWVTEWGLLIDPQNTATNADAPVEIKNKDAQSLYRALWTASMFISWIELLAKGEKIKSVLLHALNRSSVNSEVCTHYMSAAYPNPVPLSAYGCACALLELCINTNKKAKSVPVRYTGKYDGVFNLTDKIHALRAAQFLDGGQECLLIVNISGATGTITVPFSSYDVYEFPRSSDTFSFFDTVPDSTFYSSSDFFATSSTGSTYIVPAGSICALKNTGNNVGSIEYL